MAETLVGYGRRQQAVQRDVILCVDQSGSMASSVVYSSGFAAVLASLRSLRTSLVVFDTSVVDLTPELADPVEVLFGTQLGGGTDINRALACCEQLVRQPNDTILVLISDLMEGGDELAPRRRAASLLASGVTLVALLALSDDGAPAYGHENAQALAALGAPTFACTPDQFPDLMAAAIERRDLNAWAAAGSITTARVATGALVVDESEALQDEPLTRRRAEDHVLELAYRRGSETLLVAEAVGGFRKALGRACYTAWLSEKYGLIRPLRQSWDSPICVFLRFSCCRC